MRTVYHKRPPTAREAVFAFMAKDAFSIMFSINLPAPAFCRWLYRHIKKEALFPLPDPPGASWDYAYAVIGMDTSYSDVGRVPYGGEVRPIGFPDDTSRYEEVVRIGPRNGESEPIIFTVMALDKRSETEASCYDDSYLDLFGELLGAICQRWPEARLDDGRLLADLVAERWPAVQISEGEDKGKKKVGRKPLTEAAWQKREEKVDAILLRAETDDISQETACDREGIPYGTFKDWRRKLEERKKAEKG